MKNLIWICVAIICVNCDSGTGSNDSNETNTNALSVGDAFSGDIYTVEKCIYVFCICVRRIIYRYYIDIDRYRY